MQLRNLDTQLRDLDTHLHNVAVQQRTFSDNQQQIMSHLAKVLGNTALVDDDFAQDFAKLETVADVEELCNRLSDNKDQMKKMASSTFHYRSRFAVTGKN